MARRKAGFFKQIITGVDCETYDLVRILILLGCLFFLVVNGYILWLKGTIDLLNFAIGYTTIMAGGSAGLLFKQNTEPQIRTTINSDTQISTTVNPPRMPRTDL